MEHWFDRLTHPHTRRTMVKSSALAGAALLLPGIRPSAVRASTSEPCFKTCRQIAKTDWKANEDACIRDHKLKQGRVYLSLLIGGGPAVLTAFIVANEGLSCLNGSDMAFVSEMQQCRQPQCGDPGKYPGGNAPVAICRDPGWVPCGPDPIGCCDSSNAECCQCSNGDLVCCRLGANCSCCGSRR
jgi:hypothetical protein